MRTPQRLSATAIAAVAVAAAAALAGCSSASNSTATATSALAPRRSADPDDDADTALAGHRRRPQRPGDDQGLPQRIVSLDPTATEDLYAVGAGTQVVAVDQNSNFPPGAPVTSLSSANPDIGAVVKYDPSLVISRNDPAPGARAGQARHPAADRAGGLQPARRLPGDRADRPGDRPRLPGGRDRGHHAAGDHQDRGAGRDQVPGPDLLLGNERRPVRLGHLGHAHRAHHGHVRPAQHRRRRARQYPPAAVGSITSSRTSRRSSSWPTTRRPTAARPRPWSPPGRLGGHTGGQDDDIFALNDDIASRWGPRLPQLVEEIASALESFKS